MPNRQVVIDTETTGISVEGGHRVIEIACVEVIDGLRTGNVFHCYINPGREIDSGAMEIHGITNEFLEDKPAFPEISQRFIEFVSGAELIIHNAPWDISFLNHEFELMGEKSLFDERITVIDTLQVARALHKDRSCSLDALCRYHGIDTSKTQSKGALLDAEILAELYLAMESEQLGNDQESPKVATDLDIQITFPFTQCADGFGLSIYRNTLIMLQDRSDEEVLVHFGHGDPHLYEVGIDDVLLSILDINATDYWYPAIAFYRNGRDITPMRDESWIVKFLNPVITLVGNEREYDPADWLSDTPEQLDRLSITLHSDLEYSKTG